MTAQMATACLVAAGCTLMVDIGKDDGIDPIQVDRTAAVPARDTGGAAALVPAVSPGGLGVTLQPADDGGRDLVLATDAVVFTAEQSAHDLQRFGPDKIGAIRGVTLEVVSASYDGVDTTRVAAPTIALAGNLIVPPARSVDLDGHTLDGLRADLLLAQAVTLPMAIRFHVPAGAADALGATIHVTLVIQPTLHVDAGRSW
jgi:hypothetical protein